MTRSVKFDTTRLVEKTVEIDMKNTAGAFLEEYVFAMSVS